MRLATVEVGDVVAAALIEGAGVAELLSFSTAREGIIAETRAAGALAAAATGERVQRGQYRLLAPIHRPGKIFGSGINYRGHHQENPAAVMPVEPGFFSKFPSSVIGPGEAVLLPSPRSQVDYEVELAIVIGRPGKNITPDSALNHIFGYTLVNDISARDTQFRAHQMDLGKGFDTFCPMGPWIVTPDEIDDVGAVRLWSRINGELRQDASTAEWIYDVPALIAHASQNLTLEPGDIITTGTPAGCGTFRNPPLWLADGDQVVVGAEGIGELHNTVALA